MAPNLQPWIMHCMLNTTHPTGSWQKVCSYNAVENLYSNFCTLQLTHTAVWQHWWVVKWSAFCGGQWAWHMCGFSCLCISSVSLRDAHACTHFLMSQNTSQNCSCCWRELKGRNFKLKFWVKCVQRAQSSCVYNHTSPSTLDYNDKLRIVKQPCNGPFRYN